MLNYQRVTEIGCLTRDQIPSNRKKKLEPTEIEAGI